MRRDGRSRPGLWIVWEFRVHRTKTGPFEEQYGSDGGWARFFQRARGYQETILLRDNKTRGRYLTIDVWDSLESYRAFSEANAAEYREIDRRCRTMTRSERRLGSFETLGGDNVRGGRSAAASPRAARRSTPFRRTSRPSR